jgi:hypothetical protein
MRQILPEKLIEKLPRLLGNPTVLFSIPYPGQHEFTPCIDMLFRLPPILSSCSCKVLKRRRFPSTFFNIIVWDFSHLLNACYICGFKPGSSHVGFVINKSGSGAGFLRVLRFPLPIFIPPISPQSPSPIIRG